MRGGELCADEVITVNADGGIEPRELNGGVVAVGKSKKRERDWERDDGIESGSE